MFKKTRFPTVISALEHPLSSTFNLSYFLRVQYNTLIPLYLYTPPPLKQRINKRRDGGAFGKHNQQTDEQEKQNNRCKPPFFAHPEKAPDKSQF